MRLLAALLACLLLAACAPSIGGDLLGSADDVLRGPASETGGAAAAASWSTLRWMGISAFGLGLAAGVASVWLPFLRRVGAMLLALGIVLALVPWLAAWVMEIATLPLIVAMWCGVALGAALLGYRLWLHVSLRRRQAAIRGELARALDALPAGADPAVNPTVQKHRGALAAIQRTMSPAVDRGFRSGRLRAEATT